MAYTNNQCLSDELLQSQENASEDIKLANSGIGSNIKRESFPGRINTPAEKIISGQNNSYIVLGKDRVDDPQTGYGGKGYSEAGMISLVAGHSGANLSSYKEERKKPVASNPNFMLDSAYVYITQTADIDEYLSLADGGVGKSIKKSAIAIKADDVRIVADRGIKLVTSRYKEDSKRKKCLIIKGIDLIAGNDDSDLQPMLKGNVSIESLKKLSDIIDLTIDSLMAVIHWQADADAALASHQHMTATPGNPTLPYEIEMTQKCTTANIAMTQHINQNLNSLRKDIASFKETYLQPSGEKFIASRFNKTN